MGKLVLLVLLSSCSHTWQTATLGALNGAVTGFGIGGLLTGTKKGSYGGAALTAATGAITGYLIQEMIDRDKDEIRKEERVFLKDRCDEEYKVRPNLNQSPPIEIIKRSGDAQWGVWHGPHEEVKIQGESK